MKVDLHVGRPDDIILYETCKPYSSYVKEVIDATNNWNH